MTCSPRGALRVSFLQGSRLKFHAKSKQVMKQVLGIRDEKARMKVMPRLAVAPLAQEDDMRWNPNDDGIVFNP